MSILIMLNKLVDAADQSIFPCVYRQISLEFNITPTTLGSITLCQILAKSITCPLWGIAADRYSKRQLLSIGCCIWGTTSILFAISNHVFFLYLFRMLNGIGLGSVSPIMQALVSEQSRPKSVGYAFGLLSIAGMIGSSFGTLIGTSLNWRLAFWIVGILSIALSIVDWFCIKDTKSFNTNFTISQLISEVKQVFSSPSILIIMFQGIIGTIPWVAMSYITLFFQQLGFSSLQVTITTFLFTLSAGLGGFVGGILGDKIHNIVPYRGRVYVAQLSLFSGIPIVYIIFGVIKPSSDNLLYYIITLIFLGLTCSWCSTGCNR
jgi:MFS family permease